MGSWESGIGLHGDPAAPTQGDFKEEVEAQPPVEIVTNSAMIVN